MTELHNDPKMDAPGIGRTGLPKRDYLVLPLISLLTILVIFGAAEILTRLIWPEQTANPCLIEDPAAGDRFKPNCTSRTKIAEGPWTIDHYNDCGYRSATSCESKPKGSLRIGILGSSMSEALHVPYEQAFFSLTIKELSHECGRRVDVQDLGVQGSSPIYAYRRVGEILALKPDVVLYLIAPYDVQQQIIPKELVERDQPTRTSSTAAAAAKLSPLNHLERMVLQSRSVLVAQHYIFQNKINFIRVYMMYGDKADFLRQPFTPAWHQRFADLDLIIGDMADKVHSAGIPLIVIPVPSRAEAALLTSQQMSPSVDPFAFGREVERIASKHGADFVDLMEPFSQIADSENLYFVVDGHVNTDGQKVIAAALLRKLQDGSVPVFSHCDLRQSAERGH
jgi:hypothetical protein